MYFKPRNMLLDLYYTLLNMHTTTHFSGQFNFIEVFDETIIFLNVCNTYILYIEQIADSLVHCLYTLSGVCIPNANI